MQRKFALGLTAILSAFATLSLAQNTYFQTVSQAAQYCPPLYALQYTKSTNSVGTITGTNASNNFISYNVDLQSTNAPRPMNISIAPNSGLVGNAEFRLAAGTASYGYISSNNIVCFYSYQAWTGIYYNLVMMTAHAYN